MSDASLAVQPVAIVKKRKAYRVPRHQAPMDLMLDGNEGQSPSPALYDALLNAGIEASCRYPKATSFESFLADYWGLPPSRVLVTAGGDDAIDRISRTMLSEGRDMIFPSPSFEMMAQYGEIAGGNLVRIEWTPGAPYPTEAVLQAITPQTGIIAIISPNNPTGVTTPMSVIKQIAEAAPHAIILLDLAYIEFADEDPTQEALTLPNVLITRTSSKAWGLAGLRVGYALGHPDVIEWMRIAGEPYAVAGPSLVLAEARFRQDQREVNEFIQRARTERQQLQSKLADYQADVVPSQANFVFVGWHDAEWLRDGLAGMGIAIRIFPGNPALKGRTRITCPGRTDAFERLTHALDTTLAPEGLLFDMDGVLVDVSSSYREAIIQTAAHFGVTVTRDDIARIKAQGNANNDWLVTQRLLAEGGQDISLDDVTNKFEELYQGTPDRPGLRETESPMVTTEQLAAWKQELPLAVVTGRPRSDAMYLLERFGWTDLFDAVICMEDAPAKPSPEPVQRALDALGITRAWMLGDTPDDIRAARAANVLPLGVIPPGHDDTLGTQLTLVGAGRILSTTSDLQACLNGTAQGTKGTTDDE